MFLIGNQLLLYVRHLRQTAKLLALAARWSRRRRQEATSCKIIERERSKMSRLLLSFTWEEVKNQSERGRETGGCDWILTKIYTN